MVDAHCHLHDLLYAPEEIQGIVEHAESMGVTAMISNGGGLDSSQQEIVLAEKYPTVYATIGQHPEYGSEMNVDDFLPLAAHPKVVAIGECGLDYKDETTAEDKVLQQELLARNVALAKETNLPLVIHCRNAFADILQQVDYDRVQMHCFTGDNEFMHACAKRGWYMSFGGILTFKRSEYLRSLVAQIPERLLLVETDSPYLSPEPDRSSRNEPANVKIIAALVAKLRDTSIKDIEDITTENAQTLFTKLAT